MARIRTAWSGPEFTSITNGPDTVAVGPGVVATGMQEQIRAMDERDFPQVERFRGLHEHGELRDPADAARGIWGLLDRDLDNGAIIDLRNP